MKIRGDMMEIRTITQEQFDNDEFPMCSRCIHYANARSSVFGDAWGCSKGHSSADVDDNDFDVETTRVLEIHDCGDYENGEPTVCILG